jgi:hypothetical protein
VAYPFWILLGAISCIRDNPHVNIALGSDAGYQGVQNRWMIPCVALLAISIPFRVHREIKDRNFEYGAVGYSVWNTGDDSIRFRWARPHSWFFVPGDAGWVLVPLKLGGTGPASVTVEIRMDGRPVNRTTVMQGTWTMLRVVVPHDRSAPRYRRIDLEVDEGRASPAPSPAADERAGLMVGKTSLR